MTDAATWIHDPTRWPRLTAASPGTGGRLREACEDFRVDELREPPAGEGEHLLVRIEKVDLTTRRVIDHLRQALGLDVQAVGHAGMKDRRAVTTQWLSLPAASEADLDALPPLEGLRLLERARAPRKLQEGELLGNRFRIRVRGAAGQASLAAELMAELAERGVPNYYGPQRFGRDGDNALHGLALLRAGRKPRGWLDTLRCQAVQSWLFNDWLAARLAAGSYAGVVHGDVAVKHATGGKFLVGDPAAEAPRAAAFEISATGPMFGRKYHEAQFAARELEDVVLAAAGLTRDLFRPLPGARRPIRTPLAAWAVEPADDGYVLAFELPAGGYATAVLREVLGADPVEEIHASSAGETAIS